MRWFELRAVTTAPVVFQESTYQPDTTWRWMGSAAMDQQGNLALGYSASSSSINPQIRCFAVEPDTADDTRQSFRKGERVSIPPPPTIADGLRVQSPGTLTFPILQKTAEDVLTVSDDEIIETIKFLLFRLKLLVEPSGAAAAAAVFTGKLPQGTKRVGVILSGGNIDAELLSQFLR